ncbi:coiled-coil domain-containing protein 38 isoform X2 [Tupaia chinensis]|uniref:coiled-coil domain-containing protein 38 isoform X2 n=1 Tax=Tupaia chinensis TaxID=246437 RepID=UPI000FFB8FD5|nr:coiled-coil domain-containing protein 38 isoform X2 [Tupaia chinensis]
MSSNVSPASVHFDDRRKDDSVKKDRPYKIFFKDLFLFKENEMIEKRKEKIMNRSMKIYQKSTFSSRMKSRSHLSQLAFYADPGGATFEHFGLDPTLILRLTEGADANRTVYEFISDQRERFLLEYALSTKRNTIKKYEKHIVMKERQLSKAEKKLQEDAMAFEEFLRENDQRSVDALKIAAQETLNKLQTTAELKKASMEVQAVKSEIAKTEFLLKQYMKYGFFLLKLSPKHWQIQQALKRAQLTKKHFFLPKIVTGLVLHSQNKEDNLENFRKPLQSEDTALERDSHAKPHRTISVFQEDRQSSSSNQPDSDNSEDSSDFLYDEDIHLDMRPELYFKEPEELLQVLTELEEQNLTLVQYSQDVDENLEDVNKREKVIQDKINSNIEFLLEQKEMLKANCMREEEKAAELELRSRLFSFGEFNSDAQKRAFGQSSTWKAIYFAEQFLEALLSTNTGYAVEKEDGSLPVVSKQVTYQLMNLHQQIKRRSCEEKLIDSLSKKINQVYRVCIGDAEVGSLNAVQKLVKVESRLVELSDLIESIPKETVEVIERIKQKERRQRLREEKMKEKQKHQEERLKAALERAVAQPKRKLGRRLIYRSKPPSGNKHEVLLVSDPRTKTQEEEYFFT